MGLIPGSVLNEIIKLLGAGGRYANQFRLGFTLLLVVLVAQAAAVFTWQILGPVSLTGSRPPVQQKALRSQAGPRGRVAAVAATAPGISLFGVPQTAPAPVSRPDATTSAPKTTLNLELKGVIAITPKERALAIISEKGRSGEDKVYAIGDQVPGNAEVRGIYADRVILSRSGRYETLFMSEDAEAASSGSEPVGRTIATGANVTSLGDGRNWQISKSYWDEKTSDIPSLAREVGVEVFTQGDSQQGFRLISGEGSQLLAEIGLQAGDILYEVNGIKLTDASMGLTAYKRIQGASRINLVIGRDGQRLTRSYAIQDGQ